MSIIEIYGGPVTRRYLMKKSKDELSTLYLSAIDELELLRAALQAQQGDALDAARYRYLCDNAYRETFDLSESQESIDSAIDAAMLAARREG